MTNLRFLDVGRYIAHFLEAPQPTHVSRSVMKSADEGPQYVLSFLCDVCRSGLSRTNLNLRPDDDTKHNVPSRWMPIGSAVHLQLSMYLVASGHDDET